MHKSFVNYFLIFIFNLFCFTLQGAEDWIIDNIKTNGIEVYSMTRDIHGTIWMGTSNGLFTYAQFLSDDPLTYKRSECVHEIFDWIFSDALGNLWLRKRNGRYLVYNPQNTECISAEQWFKKEDIEVDYSLKFTTDSSGHLWAGCKKDLYYINVKTHDIHHVILPDSTLNIQMMSYSGGHVYIITNNAIYSSPLGHLKPRLITKPEVTLRGDIHCRETKDGILWLDIDSRLYTYYPKENLWKQHDEIKYGIRQLAVDKQNRVLVTSVSEGVFVYSGHGALLHHVVSSSTDIQGLESNNLCAVYIFPDDNHVWLSYKHSDIAIISNQQKIGRVRNLIFRGKKVFPADVTSFAAAGKNRVWVGTGGNGVYRINLSHENVAQNHMFSGMNVTCLHQSRNGILWVGLNNFGLYAVDSLGKEHVYFEGKTPYTICEGLDSSIYVSVKGYGVWRINQISGKVSRLIYYDWVVSMDMRDENIYIPTNSLIYSINTLGDSISIIKKKQYGEFLSSSVNMLCADTRGWLWMTLARSMNNVMIYTENADSAVIVPLPNIKVLSIVEDANRDMWLISNKGLLQLKISGIDNMTPYFYHKMDEDVIYNERASFASDSMLLLGTNKGYQSIYFNRISDDGIKSESPLIISSLSINGRNITLDTDDFKLYDINSDLSSLRNFSLSSSKNIVVIKTGPRNKDQSPLTSFYYQLDESDSTSWHPMNDYNITLENLSGGTHRLMLRVEGQNKKLVNVYEFITISVRTKKWNKWWTLLMCIFLVLLVTTYIIFYRKKKYLQLQNILEQRKLQERIIPSDVNIETIDKQLLNKAISLVEENMQNPNFKVDYLSKQLGMSYTSFYNKIQVLTNLTPSKFVRLLRLKRARQLLEVDSNLQIQEVATMVGYTDHKRFSRQFKQEFGLYPSEVEVKEK